MAKWAHPDVLDGGPLAIKNGATKLLLLANYAAGDSYATVQANKLAEVAVTTSDFVLSSSGLNRLLTLTSGKNGLALADAVTTRNLHVAFIDGTRVLWATDETTDIAIRTGRKINFPSFSYTVVQPI